MEKTATWRASSQRGRQRALYPRPWNSHIFCLSASQLGVVFQDWLRQFFPVTHHCHQLTSALLTLYTTILNLAYSSWNPKVISHFQTEIFEGETENTWGDWLTATEGGEGLDGLRDNVGEGGRDKGIVASKGGTHKVCTHSRRRGIVEKLNKWVRFREFYSQQSSSCTGKGGKKSAHVP